RIESIATWSVCSCIFHWASEKDAGGGSGGNQDSIEHLFASQEAGFCLSLYVYPDRSNQRRIGGRVHPGRNFVSEATTRCFEWLLEKSKPHTGKRAASAAKLHWR